jgi:hypothetical protein
VEVETIHLEQVAELDEVEASLSSRSNQMAGQNIFEAEAIPDEQVGEMHGENSTLGIPEKAGELGEAEMSTQNAGENMFEAETVGEMHVEKAGESGEAEMSLSGCSNQIGGQNMFEGETVPLEQEPLAEEIQASRAGCSAPCISLKLTEMVDMVRNEDDDDEVDSTVQSWLEDTVKGYKVDAEFMPILSKIIDKHGDIAKNCKRSVEYCSMLLERICRIVSELDKKNVNNIKEKELEKHIVLVDEIKANEIEVKWLHTRLTEIREARQILKKLGSMKDRFDSNRESIEIAESTLKAFEDKKMEASEKLKEASEKLKEASKNFEEICKKEADWKEKLARSQDKSVEISQTIENATSKVKQFLNCSLINDLL